MSEGAASCYMNQMAKSNIGNIKINTDTLKELLNNEKINFPFTTTSLGTHIPLLEEKLGSDKPLIL